MLRYKYPLSRRLGHDMNDIKRTVSFLSDGNSSISSLLLKSLRPGQQMSLRSSNTKLLNLLSALVDKVSILGMHHSNSAELLAPLEHLDKVLVADHERVLVGHERLERVDALLLAQRLHLLGDLVVVLVDARVEDIVAAGLLLGARLVQVERLDKRHFAVLDYEVHDGCCAACQCCSCACVKVVRRARAHEVELEVGVRVDTAWNYQFSLRFDCSCSAWNHEVITDIPF